MADILYLSKSDAYTMNSLRGSILFYKANNQDGRYDRALQKEEKMLKRYFSKVRGTEEAISQAASQAA